MYVEIDDSIDNDKNDVNTNNGGNDSEVDNNKIINVEKSDLVEISAVKIPDAQRDR